MFEEIERFLRTRGIDLVVQARLRAAVLDQPPQEGDEAVRRAMERLRLGGSPPEEDLWDWFSRAVWEELTRVMSTRPRSAQEAARPDRNR